MSTPRSFAVAFVPGVTPGKWARNWAERFPRIRLELLPVAEADIAETVASGAARMALIRVPEESGLPPEDALLGVPGHGIALYTENPVAVVPGDHALLKRGPVSLARLEEVAAETGLRLQEGTDAATVELVATGIGYALLPQPLARLHQRKDVGAVLLTDAPTTRIGLIWKQTEGDEWTEEFIGIVRGRSAGSSRGTGGGAALAEQAAREKALAAKKARAEAAAKGSKPGSKGRGAAGPAVRASSRQRRRQGR